MWQGHLRQAPVRLLEFPVIICELDFKLLLEMGREMDLLYLYNKTITIGIQGRIHGTAGVILHLDPDQFSSSKVAVSWAFRLCPGAKRKELCQQKVLQFHSRAHALHAESPRFNPQHLQLILGTGPALGDGRGVAAQGAKVRGEEVPLCRRNEKL